MSHLACAETPDHPMNDRQIRLFREIRILYRGLSSSLANSAGIFLGGTVYCDLVRPGLALYGANPTPGRKNPMRPVVELKGRIIQVRAVNKGETVGYGATFTAGRPSRIAVVAIGYARRFPALGERLQGQACGRSHRGRPALPARRPRVDGSPRHRRHRSCPRVPRAAATLRR